MKKKKKILFITPFGGFGGSELYIKNLIDNIDSQEYDFKVYVNSSLNSKYDNNIDYIYSKIDLSKRTHRFATKIFKFIFGLTFNERKLLKINKKFKPDYWYINTIVLPEFAQLAQKHHINYIIHIHEMPSVYSEIKDTVFVSIINNASALFVCSKKQKEYLETIGANTVIVLPGSVRNSINEIDKIKQQQLRSRYDLPKNAIVFGACGRGSYGKGFDLFVEIALSFNNPNIFFIWAGKVNNNGFTHIYINMAEKSCNKNIILLGSYDFDKTQDIFGLFDYFLLTSREDTYPLVMLEAAAMGIPTLSFDSGGVSEFVENDTGYVTQGINPIEMTQVINKILEGEINFNKNAIVLNAKRHSTQIQVENWQNFMCKLWQNK